MDDGNRVLDKNTGEVIQKFPPEGLRRFTESRQMPGLALNVQS
ncbi:hypothetical protein [Alicyclobacillus pomorum]|nr:hypothetical protein [Alicyclobacillus pomorum]